MDITLNPDGPYGHEETVRAGNALGEVVRVLNHATLNARESLPYPSTIYSLVGGMATSAHGHDQLLRQLIARMRRLAEDDGLEVTYGPYEGRESAAALAAEDALKRARRAAAELATALGVASEALAYVGMRDDAEEEAGR